MSLADTIHLQDCNLIANAFEHGAAHDTSEASVYAPLSRHLQNIGNFSKGSQQVLGQYNVIKPQSVGSQGIQLEGQQIILPTSGSVLSKAIKDCIPCLSRPLTSIDLNIGKDLLKSLQADVKQRLKILNQISDLLSNVDTYGDFCQMTSFLNFTCVPDLQRMIAILASILTGIAGDLRNLNGLLQALIAPFFLPVLLSMQTLLNQFVQLVLSPLNCIINSIQENIRKINIQSITGDPTLTNASNNLSVTQQKLTLDANQIQGRVRSGLVELTSLLDEGSALIRNKLDFYFKQLDKILKTFGTNTASTIETSNKKLIILRLIGLIQAMIKVHNQGTDLCKGQTPAPTELNNFFNTFISPNSPFNISVDPDGTLRIDEKTSPNPQAINIDAQKLLPQLFSPVSATFRCQMATTQIDVDKVNMWISQLNGNT